MRATSMPDAILAVDEIHTYYGDSYVLQGVSLSIARGQVVGLVGRNGMGKTTLIRSIVGFTAPRRGRVRFKERDITGWLTNHVVGPVSGSSRRGGAYFPPSPWRRTCAWRRGRRAVDGGPGDGSVSPAARAAENRAGKLSGGEQQMLAISRALVSNPDLLLMDEPTEGLAPLLVREVGRVIARLKGDGLSILLVEQNLPLALRIADHVHVLSRGRIVYSGAAGALGQRRDQEEVSGLVILSEEELLALTRRKSSTPHYSLPSAPAGRGQGGYIPSSSRGRIQ